MRYVLATLLALALGTQADAQLIRRYGQVYSTPSTYYYNTPAYHSGVVTAGYYSPYTWSNSVYPSSYYYSTPSWSYYTNPSWRYYSTPTWGYTNYYGGRYGGWGRRGWRW